MNRLNLDLRALRHNFDILTDWTSAHGATMTTVTKALCGHEGTIRALAEMGAASLADSRLENLAVLRRCAPAAEVWYLRPPHRSALDELLVLADVSLNSELGMIRFLSQRAGELGRSHGVVLMIELGDLREGVLPGALVDMYQQVFRLPHITVLGIGANLGCLSGAMPMVEELSQLVLYRELLELKFHRRVPLISAGTSAVLPLLLDGSLPEEINHFRIGEALLLGTDPATGESLPGLRTDVVTLEAEVVEIKEKRLVSTLEAGETPFESVELDHEPGARGYRAIVTVGQVDTDVAGLLPIDPDHTIAGASSDVTVVNVGEEPPKINVGDTLLFRPNYAAFVRLMNNPYTQVQLSTSSNPRSKTGIGAG